MVVVGMAADPLVPTRPAAIGLAESFILGVRQQGVRRIGPDPFLPFDREAALSRDLRSLHPQPQRSAAEIDRSHRAVLKSHVDRVRR